MNSLLSLSTKLLASGKTQLDHYFANPPFKIMTMPVVDPHWTQGLTAMQMSSSPGLLAGDYLEIRLSLAAGTALSLQTQAFTRVQSMNEGEWASQYTHIELAADSKLFYLPHPLVMHAMSGLKQNTEIILADRSELIYGEIVAIGRVLNNERFAFQFFSSHLQIFYQNRPLLMDTIQWHPASMSLTALSQMEDFSHQGSLLYFHTAKTTSELKALVNKLYNDLEDKGLDQCDHALIGISQLNEYGLILRVLAHNAEFIQTLFSQIGQKLKSMG